MGQARLKQARSEAGSVRMNRLVIVQWLPACEPQTGSDIQGRMLNRFGHNTPVELINCNSASDVLTAIATVTAEVPHKGIPILHIEAHGGLNSEQKVVGFVGPDGHGGETLLTWLELTEPLRALNVKTRFNLLVVGAACISEGVLFTIEPNRPLPYIGAVTFRTTVDSGRLREAMSELYRALLVNKLSIEKSVAHASKELHPDTEQLRFTSVPRLIGQAAQDAITSRDDPTEREEYYLLAVVNSSIIAGHTVSLTPYQVRRQRDDAAARVLEVTLHRMLAYERFPENKARFGFDAATLVKQVRQANPIF